jgi:hypothetical protein
MINVYAGSKFPLNLRYLHTPVAILEYVVNRKFTSKMQFLNVNNSFWTGMGVGVE